MIKRIIRILIGLILIAIGSYVYYLLGYKNVKLIYYPSCLLVIVGWFFIVFALFETRLSDIDTKSTLSNKLIAFIIILPFLFLMGINISFVSKLGIERVNNILTYQPTEVVVAEVIRKDKTTSKNGKLLWENAIIQYKTPNKIITQVIPDNNETYYIDQIVRVKYSIEYPEMFVLYY